MRTSNAQDCDLGISCRRTNTQGWHTTCHRAQWTTDNCTDQGDTEEWRNYKDRGQDTAYTRSYYGVFCQRCPVAGKNPETYWVTNPGWLYGSTLANTRQYRWPSFNANADVTCTQGRSKVNPGGVPTRCGTDFDVIFNALVRRPVSCGGATVGVCSTSETEDPPTETPPTTTPTSPEQPVAAEPVAAQPSYTG